MEVKGSPETEWMDRSHPNFKRWNRSRQLSGEKGKFVKSVISQAKECKGLTVLDLGSGEGGTTRILSEDNRVISCDFSLSKLKRQKSLGHGLPLITASALYVPFKPASFDIIILQDVIEHIEGDLIRLPQDLHKLLKPGGIIYLSTPNRNSIFNLLSDPHWGLPIVSILNRKVIRKYILPVFRKKDTERTGIAKLLSYNDISNLFKDPFEIMLNTRFAVKQLIAENNAIVWSDLHLFIVKLLKKLRIAGLIQYAANDRADLINKYFNPTFYLLLKPKGQD